MAMCATAGFDFNRDRFKVIAIIIIIGAEALEIQQKFIGKVREGNSTSKPFFERHGVAAECRAMRRTGGGAWSIDHLAKRFGPWHLIFSRFGQPHVLGGDVRLKYLVVVESRSGAVV